MWEVGNHSKLGLKYIDQRRGEVSEARPFFVTSWLNAVVLFMKAFSELVLEIVTSWDSRA
jgi:hypothetical protein